MKYLLILFILTGCSNSSSYTASDEMVCGLDFNITNGEVTQDGKPLTDGQYKTSSGCQYLVNNGTVSGI